MSVAPDSPPGPPGPSDRPPPGAPPGRAAPGADDEHARAAGPSRALVDLGQSWVVALPPAVVAAWLLGPGESRAGAGAGAALGLSLAVSLLLAWRWQRARTRKLGTMAAVLGAFREGDFAGRARTTPSDGAMVDVLTELNHLGDTLREHRLGEIEAWTLLRKVMAEVDVVVLAFNDEGHLRLANDAAARILGEPSAALLGRAAAALGLAELLGGDAPRVVSDCAPLGARPWELRRGTFRLAGEAHALVVLSDLSGALREQEREAWQRLIRVMGHEINNSLAPIQSIAQSLADLLVRSPRPPDWEDDLTSGLAVVSRRSEALGRFMTAYARLARLPPPRRRAMSVAAWGRRAAELERRVVVELVGGPDATIWGDPDQLDQLLINLLKNAAEATLERGGGRVRLSWQTAGRTVRVQVQDEGPGLSDTANLFVPFFTTKPGGSGIGLALARQIAEAHGGEVLLRTRADSPGAEAVVQLTLASLAPPASSAEKMGSLATLPTTAWPEAGRPRSGLSRLSASRRRERLTGAPERAGPVSTAGSGPGRPPVVRPRRSRRRAGRAPARRRLGGHRGARRESVF